MTVLRPAPNGHPIKLVRDKTAEVVNPSGEPGSLYYGPGDPKERLRWLRLKLAEEVGEYLVDGGVDELADVLAVVQALSAEHDLPLSELLRLMLADERGGFLDGVMMYGRHEEFDGGDDGEG